jgi:hypothetical protein
VFQALVEIHLFGGHGLGFDDQARAALFGECQHEIGDFGPVLGVDHLAAMGLDVALELLEVVIQVLDGVLLDGVGLGTQLLIFGQRIGGNGVDAFVLEPRRGRVDGQLEIGVGQRVVDLPIEFDRHMTSAAGEDLRQMHGTDLRAGS